MTVVSHSNKIKIVMKWSILSSKLVSFVHDLSCSKMKKAERLINTNSFHFSALQIEKNTICLCCKEYWQLSFPCKNISRIYEMNCEWKIRCMTVYNDSAKWVWLMNDGVRLCLQMAYYARYRDWADAVILMRSPSWTLMQALDIKDASAFSPPETTMGTDVVEIRLF